MNKEKQEEAIELVMDIFDGELVEEEEGDERDRP